MNSTAVYMFLYSKKICCLSCMLLVIRYICNLFCSTVVKHCTVPVGSLILGFQCTLLSVKAGPNGNSIIVIESLFSMKK